MRAAQGDQRAIEIEDRIRHLAEHRHVLPLMIAVERQPWCLRRGEAGERARVPLHRRA